MIKYAFSFLSVLISFIYEVLWLFFLIRDPQNVPLPLLPQEFRSPSFYIWGHSFFALVVATASTPYFKTRFHIPWKRVTFLMIFIPYILFPLFGSFLIFSILIFLFFKKTDREIEFSTADEEKEIFGMFEFENPDQTLEEYQEIMLRELEIEPFKDILMSKNTALKIGAIHKLSKLPTRESVQLLQTALKDEEADVKLMTTKALSIIEETLYEEISILEGNVKQNSKDMKLRTRLGNAYLRYANLGILDPLTQRYYFQKTIYEFLILLQQNPKDTQTLLLIGKMFLKLPNYQKAIEFFKHASRLEPDNPDIHMYLCEAYMGLKDFKSVREECLLIQSKKFKTPNAFQQATHYWNFNERKNKSAAS